MNKRVPIIAGLILTVAVLWLTITPFKPVRYFFMRLENLSYDLQLRAKVFTYPTNEKGSVSIIDIDDKSIKAEGRWPWSRAKIATLINKLHDNGVAVIAFDIFFSEPQPNLVDELIRKLTKKNLLNATITHFLNQAAPLFEDDQAFIDSMKNKDIVLAFSFSSKKDTQNQLPTPVLTLSPAQSDMLNLLDKPGFIGNLPSIQSAAKRGGFINIFPEEDGIIRRAPLIIENQQRLYPSLSLQAALTFLNEKVSLVTSSYSDNEQLEGIRIGNYTIPTDSKGFVLIPFIGPSYTFPYFSATDVLNDRIPTDALLGKIVFVGTSATGLGDLQSTSIQSPYPGVEIQATVARSILSRVMYHTPGWALGANLLLILILGLLTSFIFPYLNLRWLMMSILASLLGLFYLNGLIWHTTGMIFSLMMPNLLILTSAVFNILYGYFFETRNREHLKSIFGQYVPETHINEILKSNNKLNLLGEDKTMTVMFADIRHFTTISESLSAAELVEMLNLYFTKITEVIYGHKGTVDKYIGDLVMAFWGAPILDSDHVSHALRAALGMQQESEKLRQLFAEKSWPLLEIGIGINTGKMIVGDMGSNYRRNYTVLGDAVNVASRVESLTKFYGVSIIVTEQTMLNQTDFLFRKLDCVQVKGKKNGVNIYEVMGLSAEANEDCRTELERFHCALQLYHQQKWDEAFQILKSLKKNHPQTKIYLIYIKRIKAFKKRPPLPDWNGIFVHTQK